MKRYGKLFDQGYWLDVQWWYPEADYDALEANYKFSVAAHDEATQQVRALAAELAERDAEVQRLQRALSFWHPGVPATGPRTIHERAAADAWLLAGYDGPNEQSAMDLGWITLSNTLETPDVDTTPEHLLKQGYRSGKATDPSTKKTGGVKRD